MYSSSNLLQLYLDVFFTPTIHLRTSLLLFIPKIFPQHHNNALFRPIISKTIWPMNYSDFFSLSFHSSSSKNKKLFRHQHICASKLGLYTWLILIRIVPLFFHISTQCFLPGITRLMFPLLSSKGLWAFFSSLAFSYMLFSLPKRKESF